MSTDVPAPVLLHNSIFYTPLYNFMLFFHSFPAEFVECLIFFCRFILNKRQKYPLVSFFCNLCLQMYQKYLFAFLNQFFSIFVNFHFFLAYRVSSLKLETFLIIGSKNFKNRDRSVAES